MTRSINEILVGQITPQPYSLNGDLKRPYVISANVRTIRNDYQNATNWSGKAVMSMDGFYRPVSKFGDGGLPGYWTKNIASGDINNFSKAALPPMVQNIEPNLEISVSYLDPLVHPNFNHHGAHSGHDIDMVANGTVLTNKHISTPIARILGASDSGYYNDGRFFAVRGPIIMQGWGYDIDGYPVPNKIDVGESYVATGTGTGVMLDPTGQTQFADNWLLRSDTWPVAPIDLRLDRERGVWTVPSFHLIRLTLSGDLPANQSGNALYGTGDKQVEVHDDIGAAGYDGDEIYAFFNTHNNRLEQLINPGRKDIKFSLAGALTTSMATGSGNIVGQFGAGISYTGSSIILDNFETSSNNIYNFYGSSGDRGLARWSHGNVYVIYQLQCT